MYILAEDTPELGQIERFHKAHNKQRRRACTPVLHPCFSDDSNCSAFGNNVMAKKYPISKQTNTHTLNLTKKEKVTRKYTKLSRKCKENKCPADREIIPRNVQRLALDLSEIEKCDLAVAELSPTIDSITTCVKDVSASGDALDSPALLPVNGSTVSKDSAYESKDVSTPVCCNNKTANHGHASTPNNVSGVITRCKDLEMFSPLWDSKESKSPSHATPDGVINERQTHSNIKIKHCSVSLERISVTNLSVVSNFSQQSPNEANIGSSSKKDENNSYQKCFVRLQPLTPSTLERHTTASNISSDKEIEEMAQDMSMLSVSSEVEDNDSNEAMDVSMGEINMEDEIPGHGCQTGSFNGFTSIATPGKSVIKSLQKAESFKEALTPVKLTGKERRLTICPRDKVLLQCGQTQPISFAKCIPNSIMKKCCKIGEGTFGEVFRTQYNKQSVALKIIPIEGDFPVNDEPQKSFEDILPEIVISRELSALRTGAKNMACNYIGVIDVSLVKGRYPKHLLQEWDKFDKERESENDRPDMFTKDQLYIIFEFADGGTDLENFQFDNMLQAKSVLHQVSCALAVAEKELVFEHRDLHWGNILVRATEEDTLYYKLSEEMIEIPTNGVEVSIIDFTMSRLRKDGCTVFCNLATDETLFEGEGDYQFEVYRLMKKYNENNWEKSNPITNVLWLDYLVDKLLKQKKYKSTKQLKTIQKQFRTFHNNVLSYSSAEDVLLNCGLF
ncbi:serine/threonine-protein kinase haspin homolog [Glandiceps talaboti]